MDGRGAKSYDRKSAWSSINHSILSAVSLCYVSLVYAHLVDETHDVGVGPARLVEVVGLLQHLRQLLASHVPKVEKFNLMFNV